MKKIFALVLAFGVMVTTAFAETPKGARPNDNMAEPGVCISFDAAGFYMMNGTKLTEYDLLSKHTDGTGKACHDMIAGIGKGTPFNEYDFTTDNFKASIKLKKGSALIERYYIDDDTNTLNIKLKKNNLLQAPREDKSPNLVFEYIKIHSTKTIKDGEKYAMKSNKNFGFDLDGENGTDLESLIKFDPEKDNYNFVGASGKAKEWFVGHDGKNGEPIDSEDIDYTPGYNHFVEGSEPRANATFEGDGVTIEGRVYQDDKIFINVDRDFNDKVKELWKANDAIDPELEVYNVELEGINGTHKITFDDVEEGSYFYTMDKNGKLTKANVKWDENEYAYRGTIAGNTTYIVSDKQLKALSTADKPAADSEDEDDAYNPDTGANDVAGLAAAIGAVSLLAAGVVAFKKK